MVRVSGVKLEPTTTKEFIENIEFVESKIRTSLQIISDIAAKKMADWARENRPWTDRTHHAKQRLKGEGYWEDRDTLVCAVMHMVDYGIWLELCHEKKYAVLEDAIESHREELIRNYVKILGG